MEEIFEEIIEKEKGEFKSFDNKFSNIDGSRFTVSTYKLNLEYKNHIINISNELGNHNLGNVQMTLESGTNISNFEVTNKSHFWRLFNPKSNILKIECKNTLYKNFIQELLISSGLEKISRKNLFEPKIYSDFNDYKNIIIVTEYHLEFEDKKGALQSLIKFYKSIIDNL